MSPGGDVFSRAAGDQSELDDLVHPFAQTVAKRSTDRLVWSSQHSRCRSRRSPMARSASRRGEGPTFLLAEAIVGRHLLAHPFYRRWEAGTLSEGGLAAYAEQYRHIERELR